LILHVGYGWLAMSFLILGGGMLGIGLPLEDAIHAFTTGAVGVMTLAVMTRASLGHTGRVKHAGPLTLSIYLLVIFGAILRVFGPSLDLAGSLSLPMAAGCWSGAYLLFAIGSGLTRTAFGLPIPDGKRLIHSTVSAEDINKDYTVDIGMVGDAKLTLEMMIDEIKGELGEKGRGTNGSLTDSIATVKAEWLAEWQPLLNSDETPINPYRVINEINKAVDHENTVMTHDAGNPRDQIMPFYKATTPHGYIGWGKTTHLGYGIPLVMGAKMADPSKFCMNLMGDLAFGHTGMEIETAVRAQIPITTIVINNGTMGGYDKSMPTAMEKYGAGNQTGDYAVHG